MRPIFVGINSSGIFELQHWNEAAHFPLKMRFRKVHIISDYKTSKGSLVWPQSENGVNKVVFTYMVVNDRLANFFGGSGCRIQIINLNHAAL